MTRTSLSVRFDRVLQSAVQTEPANRIVEMSGISGNQNPAVAESGGNALVDAIDRAVDDLVAIRLRLNRLEPFFDRRVGQGDLLALIGVASIEKAPQSRRSLVRQAKDRAPFDRMRDVGGIGEAVLAEIVGGADKCKRSGNVKPSNSMPAHLRATLPPPSAPMTQPASKSFAAVRRLRDHANTRAVLGDVFDAAGKPHLRVGHLAQAAPARSA